MKREFYFSRNGVSVPQVRPAAQSGAARLLFSAGEKVERLARIKRAVARIAAMDIGTRAGLAAACQRQFFA